MLGVGEQWTERHPTVGFGSGVPARGVSQMLPGARSIIGCMVGRVAHSALGSHLAVLPRSHPWVAVLGFEPFWGASGMAPWQVPCLPSLDG